MKQLFILLITGVMIGNWGCKSVSPGASKPLPTQVTLLQINDVYEIAPLEKGKVGGLARVATLDKTLLAANPNTRMVLAGDFLSPSVIGTVKIKGERVRGEHMVDMLNKIGLDLAVFGNHEFDIGGPALQARINESQFEWISGNVKAKQGEELRDFAREKASGQQVLQPYTIWKFAQPGRDSLRMGIISVCLNSNQVDFAHYDEVYTSAQQQYNSIKDQTDFVIALTHLAIEQDREVAKRIPQLKLIMGGHEHENHFERVGKVPIAKADANAKSAYIHQIAYNPKNQKVQITSTLKLLNEEVPLDPQTSTEVGRWEAKAYQAFKDQGFELDEVVATLKEPLDGLEKHIRTQPTNLGIMLAEAMYTAGETADAAIVNGGSVRLDDYLSGSITQFDLIRALPFGGKVVLVDMKGKLLQQLLEAGKKNKGTGGYLQTFAIGEDNGAWMVGKQPLNPEKKYRIATTDFLLSGLEKNMDFFTQDNPHIIAVIEPGSEEILRDIRLVFAALLKEQK